MREEAAKGRTILVVGDGALQLSVQEVGTLIREGLGVIMCVFLPSFLPSAYAS